MSAFKAEQRGNAGSEVVGGSVAPSATSGQNKPSAPVSQSQFRTLFCKKFGCSPEEYEERAFWMCLFGRARIIAVMVRAIFPNFFLEDFKFIRYLGDSTGSRDATVELLEFNDFNRKDGGFLRNSLGIRVSGRKAKRLASQLFREAREASGVLTRTGTVS